MGEHIQGELATLTKLGGKRETLHPTIGSSGGVLLTLDGGLRWASGMP